ncbi:MAG: carboxypeptidase-like regulatory domain-containing protein [Planctomycetia bacterium]|nr:carboxypeptidase-like regulatory domain-containing protein [Planctomycetia bacterium]
MMKVNPFFVMRNRNLSRGLPLHSVLTLLCAFTLLSGPGCGGPDRPADMPKLHKISIKLTQNGQPVDGAQVSLQPQSPSKWSSGGLSDTSGICRPRTQGKFDGVPQGSYDVTVSKIDSVETGKMLPGALPGKEVPEVKRTRVIDPKFSTPGQLSLDVTTAGPTEFSFELGEPVSLPLENTPPGKK